MYCSNAYVCYRQNDIIITNTDFYFHQFTRNMIGNIVVYSGNYNVNDLSIRFARENTSDLSDITKFTKSELL